MTTTDRTRPNLTPDALARLGVYMPALAPSNAAQRKRGPCTTGAQQEAHTALKPRKAGNGMRRLTRRHQTRQASSVTRSVGAVDRG
jgi:hypothetical protein